MSLLESKAFDNFVKERVIEILQEDEGYVKINEQISNRYLPNVRSKKNRGKIRVKIQK
jgi:hypothetical protein